MQFQTLVPGLAQSSTAEAALAEPLGSWQGASATMTDS